MSILNLLATELQITIIGENFVGPITTASGFFLKRINNLVYLSYPNIISAVILPGFTQITATNPLPEQFRPKISFKIPVFIQNNSVDAIGYVEILSNGVVTFNSLVGAFTGNSGARAATVCWDLDLY